MNNVLVFSVILLLNAVSVFGQNQIINLWKGDAPYNKGVQVEEINNNNHISSVTVPQLYHYTVKNNRVKPAVIIIPGGGYGIEAFDHEGIKAAEWFNKLGIEAFVLKYRLPDDDLFDNSSYVPLMDGQQAVYLVRSKAKEYNVDPNNIGVIGFSAGGHLAASVSTLFTHPVDKNRTSDEVRPDFSVLMYPVISMDKNCTHMGSRKNLIGVDPTVSMVEYFSLENQVGAQTPKTIIIHSIDDKTVPVENTDRYAQKLFDKGGDVTKVILPVGGHGFGFYTGRPVSYWTQYLEVWLKTKVMN